MGHDNDQPQGADLGERIGQGVACDQALGGKKRPDRGIGFGISDAED